MASRSLIKQFDWVLFGAAMLLTVIGLSAVYSATLQIEMDHFQKQLIWTAVGLGIFLITVGIGYRRFLDFSYLFYLITVLALAGVLVWGDVRYGARRWLDLGFVALQPSEFVKPVLIIVLARFVGANRFSMGRWAGLLRPLFLVALPFFLVLLEPDLGTALILLPFAWAILHVGGGPAGLLRVSVVSGAALAPLGWIALKEYQKQRILSFWNPDADPLGAGYTVIQSKIAVGSGGLLGKGWLSGTQNQLNFLPERHTDFIFSVIGEEWGFVGSLVLLFLFGLLFYRIYRVGLKAVDWEGRLLCVGVIVWISTQVLINICMTIGLMPVVGLPLPFLSKGGSHVMSTWFALGLVLSVSRTARR